MNCVLVTSRHLDDLSLGFSEDVPEDVQAHVRSCPMCSLELEDRLEFLEALAEALRSG